MSEEGEMLLFDVKPDWQKMWAGMPEYDHKNLEPFQSVQLHFKNRADREAFSKLVGQTISDNTKYLWYPKIEIGHFIDKRWESEESQYSRYPIYIISKGRWESRMTSKAMESIGQPYFIVVEPQEFKNYASVIDERKILQLPFSNLGQGSIPARNWVWEHAKASGAERHWILDDNIRYFCRFQNNLKVPVSDPAIFRAAEDFVDRYENVALAGFQYWMFVPRKTAIPPFLLNTRIYSCILIKNDLPYGWRGRYNEDTDLSIRALKDGWCTVLFNAFICDKMTTMTMKGGNTDELYVDDGRLKMAEALRDLHPDVCTITRKWDRWQHQVDYTPFAKNELRLRPGFEPTEMANNYGMDLRKVGQA